MHLASVFDMGRSSLVCVMCVVCVFCFLLYSRLLSISCTITSHHLSVATWAGCVEHVQRLVLLRPDTSHQPGSTQLADNATAAAANTAADAVC